MSLNMQVRGVRETMAALREVPRRVQLRHVRIGLSKGAGMLRDAAAGMAPKDTGILKRSMKVKVKVPDASFNKAHHSKPAYAVIGAARIKSPYRRKTSSGRMIGHGAANKEFRATLKADGSIRRSRAHVESIFSNAIYRSPSRYSHLAERGARHHRGQFFHRRAVSVVGPAAQRAAVQKMHDGVIQEANMAYARSIGR
jgi:hypothetical protein